MIRMIDDAEFIERAYPAVAADAVVSSGHSFLIRTRDQEPPARAMQDKRIARTLRSLADHALVEIEPRVWRTQDRDLLIRLDGFGPTVDVDADAARLAVIDAIGALQTTEEQRVVIVDALHAIASCGDDEGGSPNQRFECSAPVAWRPACCSMKERDVIATSWWTGPKGTLPEWAVDAVHRDPLERETAAILPRAACIEDGAVTLDGSFGMRIRPLIWTGPRHRLLDPMGIIRARAALAEMLARHPLRNAGGTR
jgi:hypothetical protein